MYTLVILHLNMIHKHRVSSIEVAREKFQSAFPAWRGNCEIKRHPNSVAITVSTRQLFDQLKAALN